MIENEDQPSKEGPLPFWLKALAIVMLVPVINSVIPGSIVWLFMLMGLPDPTESRQTQTITVSAPARRSPEMWRSHLDK